MWQVRPYLVASSVIDYHHKAFGPEFGFTNTYIVGPTDSDEVVVVDPGRGSAPWVHHTLDERGLDAVAVLLTHGHMDHTWDAAPLADTLRIPVHLPRAGHHLLARPEEGLPAQFPHRLIQKHPHRRPLELLAPAPVMRLAGLQVTTVPTPGHTPCSVTYVLDCGSARIVCTGDTLLGNGRVSTPVPPGGDAHQLSRSTGILRAAWIHETCTILPGHGNPYQIMP
ncbi:MBL fold metallo-hydrolase [Williamsia sp.]|uniref:MBL fold metallo-hydrolase n=1 Tax=Williamsia sp. TaxID=1872085 RepID=UPI0039C9A8CF